MRNWFWTTCTLLLCAAILVQAKDNKKVPSDDRKEPNTLNNLSSPKTAQPLAPPADVETSYQPETTYQITQPLPGAVGSPLKIKAGSVDKTVDSVPVHGYQARPVEEKPVAAILLVHEWWGVNAAIKKEANELASQGYAVLAVDLYNGEVARTRQAANSLMAQVKPDKALAKLKAAVTLLAKNEGGPPLKVGVIGWSFGAGLAAQLAATDSRPAALVLYYGELPKDPKQAARIACPILGFYALQDPWITTRKVQTFKKAVEAAKGSIQIESFDTRPGFALAPKDDEAQKYAETAYGKTLEFLRAKLKD